MGKVARIEITAKVPDTQAAQKLKQFKTSYGENISQVEIADVYTVDKSFTTEQLEKIGSILSNPVSQTFSLKSIIPKSFDWAIEIGYLPGVTDNVAGTAKEIIEDMLKVKFVNEENVYTSRILFITTSLNHKQIEKIVEGLINPLIQRSHIKSNSQFLKDKGMDPVVPKVKLNHQPQVIEVDLNIDDEELVNIGKVGIKGADGTRRGPLALEPLYMKAIQKYFKQLGRNPTDIELETFAQTWSEHCKHTIFANPIHDVSEGIFKKYIKQTTEQIRKEKGKKDICVSVFTDNSGAIDFDKDYLITHKVETHNSPSALDPFGGAITGIVGVNRDTIGFGLGAKPIANTYGFCFADPDDTKDLYRDQQLSSKMLSPRRILEGVVAGVNSGGNCSGIPTPQGFIYFDERYKGKPLVFVGTLGIIPKKVGASLSHIKQAIKGDYIVMVGGRVGLDGIHGATFSSESLDSGSPASAVQIGDPITQKKFSDALVKEARDLMLYNSITDNGAGGLSSSVGEMAKDTGGFKVELEKVPLKYPGLDPWQIWVSESQERMTLSISKKNWPKFQKLMEKRGVEATVIGEFTNTQKAQIFYKDKKIMDLDMEFLHEGLPQKDLEPGHSLTFFKDPKISEVKNLTSSLNKMLNRLNFSSFEFISQQFDHEVQANSVLKPLQGRGRVNGDTSVIRPLFDSNKGIALSQGLYPLYSDINTYDMAAASIDTAVRNVLSVGADLEKIALLDNFCWCSSTESNRLGQLRRAARACQDIALAYGTPFISGKDSMFNDFKGYDSGGNPIKISIPPTLLISSIGIIDDVLKVVSIDTKFPGDLVYVLGETHAEMGGSEFYMMYSKSNKKIGHRLPRVDTLKNLKLYKAYKRAIDQELIVSSIALNRGGLGIGLAKSAMAGLLGMDINLKTLEGESYRDDFALFSETQGRFLVTINPKDRKKFEKIMAGNSISLIGVVTDNNQFTIKGFKTQTIVNTIVEELLVRYTERFKNY